MRPKTPKLKTAELLKRADGARNVAEALGITTQAVYMWGRDVPVMRIYQLLAVKPAWFEDVKA